MISFFIIMSILVLNRSGELEDSFQRSSFQAVLITIEENMKLLVTQNVQINNDLLKIVANPC